MAKCFASTFIVIALILVPSMSRAEFTVANIGDIAEITVGADLKFSKSSERMPDFSLYYIRKSAKIILSIYLGNAPDIDIHKLADRMSLGGCSSVPTARGERTSYNFDAVIQLRDSEFPKFVHLFSRDVPAADVADVQKLLQSFRVVPPHHC
jgi:hypothetical protein